MTAFGYEVRSITLDTYDNITEALQEALAENQTDGSELVSCFPVPEHRNGELHQVPLSSEGSKPYDDVWRTPTGPSFIAIFRHSSDN